MCAGSGGFFESKMSEDPSSKVVKFREFGTVNPVLGLHLGINR